MKKLLINVLPYFIIKLIAPYISTLDQVGINIYYRILDKRGCGAELLIFKEKEIKL